MYAKNDMADDLSRLRGLMTEGYCCAQIMIIMALECKGEEAGQAIVDAFAALCEGLHRGLICGALSGAACLLSLFDKDKAARDMIPELVDWFAETYGESYRGINCHDITGGDKITQFKICPQIIEATYLQAKDVLNRRGYNVDTLWNKKHA